jgi:hypothetical protein
VAGPGGAFGGMPSLIDGSTLHNLLATTHIGPIPRSAPLVAKQFREETNLKTRSENLERDPPHERMNSTAVRTGYLGRGQCVCATGFLLV